MEVIETLVALALTIFIFVALAQLFSINKGLQRLVALAEESRAPESAALLAAESARPVSEMKDGTLMTIWKSDPNNAAVEQELRTRGYHMG